MRPRDNRVRNLGINIFVSICLAIAGTFIFYGYFNEDKPAKTEATPIIDLPAVVPAERAELLMRYANTYEAELRETIKTKVPDPATAEFKTSRFYITDTTGGLVAYTGTGISKNSFGVPAEFSFLYLLQIKDNKVSIATSQIW